ncbi:hypothetical protein DY000_02060892 [Brassica cretica]|uniref:Uncharacterized protein n=1 Tax=Brassica cretica TaxID=69181 RepID=A0ABQ7AP31_BRACR|nr:hypothetical protein DY000_02060892 [Brassica cretica]
MSFGGSHWCRPMSMDAHRSTDQDEDRSTDYSRHRSTSSAESTAECTAVRIMTHEEFAEKHPHPPSPFYVKIDRLHEPAHENLGEGDFEVESSMSFGGSHWCRPMSMDVHRSTDQDEDRSTDYSRHRSTSSAESILECTAVRIMTHEEFAEKHPHPPSPFYVKIDRLHEPAVDRQRETNTDRPPSPPIDRRTPFTHRPLDRGYNQLFGCMAELRTEIESMQHNLEKEATTSTSIDANKATSIDVKPQTSQNPAEPESLAKKKDEWEIAYINTRINQELDTIRMNDPQPATWINICNITSIDTRFAEMKDRLKSYEDMHDRFTSPIMRYLDTFSTQMTNVQKDIGKLNDQHYFKEESSTSIDRFRRTSLDGNTPTEHLPYTADAVDQITSKLYKAIDTLEDRLEKRCDDIYFPFDVKISGLDSQAEWRQKEVKAIQRQLASQHQISASINGEHSKLIDSATPAMIDRHLVASIDTTSIPDDAQLIPNHMESMHEQLNELSEYAYSKISCYQFSIEDILERLQNISNAVQKMDERWTRNDEATRKHATTFTPTTLASDIYTKDEINEMVTGICGTQEKLGDELKTLVDDTYQPLGRGYNELFRCMAEMRTEIESMQHNLEKEATTSTSIDANKGTSIDVKPQTSQTLAKLESLAEKKDEWEIAYINTTINDIYNPLNNNVDWLSTRIDLLQQELDTIRMNDPQPATSIDICNITSIDARFAAVEDKLKSYEDMHNHFTSPIMRYLDTLST